MTSAPRILLLGVLGLVAACAADPTEPDPIDPPPPPPPAPSEWRMEIAPTGDPDFRDIAAVSPDDALAVGIANLAVHWDGSAWRPVPPGLPADLEDAFALPDGRYLVAGNAPRYYVFDAGAWETRPALGIGGHTSIWASSVDDVYLAGSQERLVHVSASGASWVEMEGVPITGVSQVWGSGPADVWAVGQGGLFHFDGTQWSEVPLGITDVFADLDGLPTGELFAITLSGKLYAWNGANWWIEQLAVPGLWGGWMSGPKQVRLFARNGSVSTWDDGTFTAGQAVGPAGFWCRGAAKLPDSGALVVERRGSVFLHGASGLEPHSLAIPPREAALAIWGASAEDFVVARAGGRFLHRIAGAWQLHDLSGFSTAALWGSAPERVFAAGVGVARFDGSSWSRIDGAPTFALSAIHGAGDLVVAVGAQGRVTRWTGEEWTTDDLGTTKPLTSVWTDGPDNIYVGERGRELVARFDGTGWSPLPSVALLTGGVLAIWGDAEAAEVTLAMSDEGIYQLQGGTWVALRDPGTVGVLAVRPLSAGVALIVRNDGAVELLADGEVSDPMLPPGPIPTRIWGWGPASFLVASGTGGIWSYAPPVSPGAGSPERGPTR